MLYNPSAAFHVLTSSGTRTAPLKFFGIGAKRARSGLAPLETAAGTVPRLPIVFQKARVCTPTMKAYEA